MVNCIPVSMLADVGISESHLKSSNIILRGVSRKILKNHGFTDVVVTCNRKRDTARFYATDSAEEILLGLQFCKRFGLVEIAETCIQREVTAEHVKVKKDKSGVNAGVNAVHIIEESTADYAALGKKWRKFLPLGKKKH